MYGIINKSIEELVVANYGFEKWEEIKAKSKINTEYFISNETYDDEITFSLATVIATQLEITIDDVLKNFGELWIMHTAKNYYSYLLESGGAKFPSFMLNLPMFHNRVMMLYPKLTPPEFKISNLEEHALHLHYYSKRKGLTAFVIGLILGLGKFFATEVSAELIESIPNINTYNIIKVTWKNP